MGVIVVEHAVLIAMHTAFLLIPMFVCLSAYKRALVSDTPFETYFSVVDTDCPRSNSFNLAGMGASAGVLFMFFSDENEVFLGGYLHEYMFLLILSFFITAAFFYIFQIKLYKRFPQERSLGKINKEFALRMTSWCTWLLLLYGAFSAIKLMI